MFRNASYAFLAVPLVISSGWSQAATTLKDAAKAVHLNIGVATNSFNVSNSTYAAAVKAQFNTLVCENEMKWSGTENSRGNFTYNGSDQVAKFAADNNMKLRGHTFVWHSQSGYASGVSDAATLKADMENHIDKVGTHFKGKVFEWDVLNEITADGGGGLRNSFWTKVTDFHSVALKKAREVLDTTAYLVYNDYGADGDNSKSDAIYSQVQKWKAANVPIDGIGLQCHLSSPVNKSSISSNIKRFGDLGVRISLTEIDIKNGTTQDWVNLLNACLENANCMNFVAWGLADGNSWLGSNCNCLLYSGSANSPTPKAHIQAMIEALNAAATSSVTAKRKEWFDRKPGQTGPTNVLRFATPKAGKAPVAALFGAAAAPVYSTGNGNMVDIMGRNRLPVLKAGPDGLRLEAR